MAVLLAVVEEMTWVMRTDQAVFIGGIWYVVLAPLTLSTEPLVKTWRWWLNSYMLKHE